MSTPPQRNFGGSDLPVLNKASEAYKLWQSYLPDFPQTSRHTLGAKIDSLFVETVESIFTASWLYKDKKPPYIQKAVIKSDALKFFLHIAWEIKSFDNKKYIALSEMLNEIGKMLGGWLKYSIKENPTK